MESSRINRIRETIALAKEHELADAQLSKQLAMNLDRLHDAILLPKHNEVKTLVSFVINYIEHVPDFLLAMSKLTQEAGIASYSDVFLDIAKNYFLEPPACVQQQEHYGLLGLLDEAYLAHRFMEEVNDRFISLLGVPLAPMDMVRANIVVHDLIGEPFANELDRAVHDSLEQLMPKEPPLKNDKLMAYVNAHKDLGWSSELCRWPCLAEDLSVGLHFGKLEIAEFNQAIH